MLTKEISEAIDNFILGVSRKQSGHSLRRALDAANIIKQIVNMSRWENINELLSIVQNAGEKIIKAQPKDLVMFNVICRMKYLIRFEAGDTKLNNDVPEKHILRTPMESGMSTPVMALGHSNSGSVGNLIQLVNSNLNKKPDDQFQAKMNLKNNIIQGLNDFIDELENTRQNIASHASDHIHSNEIIMTCGHSKTVEMYLKSAARKRRFMVIITESAPSYKGHDLAKSLSGPNIEAIVIPDAAVFAMMSRVNKVILGTHTIMANGGLISDAGTQMIATAAKYHSIPVVVCAGLYKLSPIFPFDQDRFNTLESPDGIFPYKDGNVKQY
ncbi:Translation initiation factor eIF-2B subunit beta [Smittium culicis]|uniref:Translation initiation factor eIF2B subunit beta n=1 Tax=Smittium culicis TaxID=133412 RepID=A0A1R1YI44_9FUNG|nr:Translation initiation factor eIF-2B subunit beta [Smittium culicis]